GRLRQALHEGPQAAVERAPLVARGVPELLQVVELLFARGPLEALGEFARGFRRFDVVLVISLRLLLGLVRLVGCEDAPLPLAEYLHERVEARPEAGDLPCVEADGPGQLLLGQLAGLAVEEQMFHDRRAEG